MSARLDLLDEDEAPVAANTREPLSPEMWARVLKGQPFIPLVNTEQREWAGNLAKRCLSCANIGTIHGDPRRAWCPTVKALRSDAFPVLCPHYRDK